MNKLKKLIKIICFIIFWPIGIFFIIKSKYKKKSKVLLGIISFLIFIMFWGYIAGSSNQQNTVDSGKATVNTKVDENYNVANNSNDTSKNADNNANDSNKNVDNNANANSDSSKSNENIDNSTTTKVNNDVKNNEPKKASNVEHKTNHNVSNVEHKTNNQNNAEKVQAQKPKAKEHKENVQNQPTGNYGVISFNSSTKKAILHSGPDSHSGDIEHLDNGERVEILGMSGAYYRVKASDGNVGYVSDRFVK